MTDNFNTIHVRHNKEGKWELYNTATSKEIGESFDTYAEVEAAWDNVQLKRKTTMRTKLTEEQLIQLCKEQGVRPTRDNMASIAFFNDVEFREQVTKLMFERAVSAAKDSDYCENTLADDMGGINRFGA